MPAVSVPDITILPRVDANPTSEKSRPRTVKQVTTAPQGFEGEGFPVRRAFAGIDLAELDPFIHLDQMGEVEYAPGEPKGTPWHPHRGFETVTYIIDGIFDHMDSNGGGGTITNGDTQWMTAGAGILHIETPPEHLVVSGGLFHGFQLWVNLPKAQKWSPPAYQDVRANDVALLASHDGGALLRVIAGEIAGPNGTYKGPGRTRTPITLIHATLSPGAQLRLPWRRDFNALAYTLNGFGTMGLERRPVKSGQMTVFSPSYGENDSIIISADDKQESRMPQMDVFILGGQPIKEPVAWMGPFVMNTKSEVLQAFDDFQKGKLGRIPTVKRPSEVQSNNIHDTHDIHHIHKIHGTPDELQES